MTSITAALRPSILDLSAFRRLTNREVQRLINDPSVNKVISEPVHWSVTRARNDRPLEVRTKVVVVNSLGERLFLDGRNRGRASLAVALGADLGEQDAP